MISSEEQNCLVRVVKLEAGKKYFVKTRYSASPTNENGSIYPWGKPCDTIPVLVYAEHEHFYTVDVLPHYSHSANFGLSKPYKVSIEKRALKTGEFKAYEYYD